MKNMTCRIAFAAIAVFLTASAVSAAPVVNNVVMTQREASRIVDITYDLVGEAAIITLGIETNDVPIPDRAVTWLSGDVSTVIQPGIGKHIVWNAGVDWPEHAVTDARARVTAWSSSAPPQVMVIDLSKGRAATVADPYPVYYYTSLAALPYGGLSNDVYKTEMLVMNKIPKGNYWKGFESSPSTCVFVTLTQDFYMGVYEVTQKQWYKIIPSSAGSFHNSVYPVESKRYDHIRGAELGAGWPTNDFVDASSFIGLIRTKTGLSRLDLPTEAQWEYACRAGTTTYFNRDDIEGGASTNQLNELGWWKGNSMTAANSGGQPHPVGQKTPNAWGLYDMHGNVAEWCLDWHIASLTGGEDPKGPAEVTYAARVIRGGSWNHSESECRSAYRARYVPSSLTWWLGFRLAMTLPPIAQ